MGIKKTLPISLFIHVTLISVALLLSAGGGGIHDVKVLFVNLTEDTGLDRIEEMSAEKLPVDNAISEPAAGKEEKNRKVDNLNREKKSVEEIIPVKERVSYDIKKSNTEEKPALTVESEKHGNSVTETDKKEVIINASHTPLSIDGAGVFEHKRSGVVSPDMIELISKAIEQAKTYPLMARRRGIEGTVYVSFRISPEGDPTHIEILKSSGHNILDTATMDVVRKAAPYPYFESRIEVPIIYKLKD
jgi:TonB family protein